MYKILTLNNIAVAGLNRLPRGRYEVASEIAHPDAVLVRSANMHDMHLPESVRAIGRAGAGVNNIPVARMTELGIPVFNAPGANANAVKELVLAGMLLAARNIAQAWGFARGLSGARRVGVKSFVLPAAGPQVGARNEPRRGGRRCWGLISLTAVCVTMTLFSITGCRITEIERSL
jgi:hypothetical protein